MPSRSEIVGRLSAELVVIVAGVLIALAGQSAYQEWTDRQAEREFLLDLLEEFRANKSQLQIDLEATKKAVDAADQWRGNPSNLGLDDNDSDANSYAASLNPARFDPISGSLRSLIDGGELGLIRNRQLRADLAGWSDRAQEQILTSVTVDMMRSMLMQFLIPQDKTAPTQALELDRNLLQVTYDQQRNLLELINEIILKLELEVGG